MEWLQLFSNSTDEPLLFHHGFFLFIFSVFLIYYALVFNIQSLRDISLILFGFYFYYKSSGIFLCLLIACISADYLFSLWIAKTENRIAKKAILISGIMFSLSFLFYFKYSNFFMENWAGLTGANFSPANLILPIGISFYTFQSISYMVDVYQNKIKPGAFKEYVLYMTFFPHLVAGPIVRAKDFLPQIAKPTFLSKDNVNEALYLITKGFIKKAIIADFVAQYADNVFSTPDGFNGTEHLISILCYTLQIFCDFSGYTDMAIGIALLLGFKLCVNFDSPYKSFNITDFWRRWHISLSSWLRDYIYIPLGGNKNGLALQLLFLLLTMLIGGFWHGASWKFVFWGAGHGFLLIFHKFLMIEFPAKNNSLLYKSTSWILTFVCVALLWVPFRANTLTDAMMVFDKLFTAQNLVYLPEIAKTNSLLIILLLFGFMATLLPTIVKMFIKDQYFKMHFILKIALFVVLIQCMLQLQSETVQPFIYFQF